MSGSLAVVGLGPGDAALLTESARRALDAAEDAALDAALEPALWVERGHSHVHCAVVGCCHRCAAP